MSPGVVDLWALFGLRESPFFQDTLAPGSSHPGNLFVGRENETNQVLRAIGSSRSSRQVLHGPPGVGKTTLAQHAKGILRDEGYVVRGRAVSVVAGQSSTALVIDILASVHEAVFAARPLVADREPMEAARALVRAFRQTDVSAGLSIMGSGVEGARQTTYVRPVDAGIMQEALRILLEMSDLACREHEAAGIVIHINNLENLTTADSVSAAALAFRDLRDLFLERHFHWIVVGTTDEALGILGAYPQVRSVFLPSLPALAPLTAEEFLHLLHARYEHLGADGHEVIPPVSDAAAAAVYRLFKGDLRGTLRTLDQGCLALAGLTDEPIRPLEFVELTATLKPIYAAEMLADLADSMVAKMRDIAEFRGEGITQAQLQDVWGVSRQRVSVVVRKLEERGYVGRAGTSGRSRVYTLSGTGLIALGLAD
jgi:energy-coupling factor transporter ATP-binding protein EcfA2